MLTLTVLGCDGSHAGAGGAASGYLVRSWTTGTALWLDAGPGTFANLQRFCDPRTLDAVVLSHEHGDHWSDIAGFVTAAHHTLGWKRDPVPVLAAPGVEERLGKDAEGILEWRTVGDGEGADVGGMRLTFSRTDHGPVTLAVRVEGDGSTLGYSADSGPGLVVRGSRVRPRPRPVRGHLHVGPRRDGAAHERTAGRDPRPRRRGHAGWW